MKFVTGGGIRVDYLITNTGEAYVGLPGGNAVYAAVGALLWQEEAAIWGRVGGNYPVEWLAQLGRIFDTSGLKHLPEAQDHRTFFAYLDDGRRDDTNPAAHFARIGRPLPPALADYVHSTPQQNDPHQYEPLALRPSDWPETFAGVTAVHLSPHPLRSHWQLPPFLREQGVGQITLDPGERYMVPACESYLRQFLPHLDAFLPSEQEIVTLFGANVSAETAAGRLCEWGTPLVVVKRGAAGVLVQERERGRRWELRPYHSPDDPRIIDVTGAGDAFCGGFMVGLAQSGDPYRAAQMRIVSASLVIEGYGALYALARKEESQSRLEKLQA